MSLSSKISPIFSNLMKRLTEKYAKKLYIVDDSGIEMDPSTDEDKGNDSSMHAFKLFFCHNLFLFSYSKYIVDSHCFTPFAPFLLQ